MFFKQWIKTSTWISATCYTNNYCQALNIIEHETIEFKHTKLTQGITDENIQEWQKQQLAHLETLDKKAEGDM